MVINDSKYQKVDLVSCRGINACSPGDYLSASFVTISYVQIHNCTNILFQSLFIVYLCIKYVAEHYW